MRCLLHLAEQGAHVLALLLGAKVGAELGNTHHSSAQSESSWVKSGFASEKHNGRQWVLSTGRDPLAFDAAHNKLHLKLPFPTPFVSLCLAFLRPHCVHLHVWLEPQQLSRQGARLGTGEG